MAGKISIKGARVHNLKNIDVDIPRDKFVVVTGLCANEMSKRLEDAGAKNIKTISDINKAVEYIGKSADNNITILTTYTALLKIDKIQEMKKCF